MREVSTGISGVAAVNVEKRKKITGILKNEEGSIMVEAAFLYPFIIVVSVSLLFIMVSFYQMVEIKADLDVIALKESGVRSGVYIPKEKDGTGKAEFQRRGLYEAAVISHGRFYGDWGILKRTEEKKEMVQFSAVKESDFIRGSIILDKVE